MVNHTDLISTLEAFFTLLTDLTVLTKDELVFPSPTTGLTPDTFPEDFASEALGAGYSQQVVDLIPRLPRLRSANHDGAWLLYSTYMNDLKHGGLSDREIYELPDAEGDDKMWPRNVVPLTNSNHYGTILAYDVDTGLLRAWEPFSEATNSWKDVPALPPSEVFAPWMQKYRSLTWLPLHDCEIDWYERDPTKEVPESKSDPLNRARWKANAKLWRLKHEVKQIYIECGWDVDSRSEQTNFNREEFLQRRNDHWKTVVQPFEVLIAKLHDDDFEASGEIKTFIQEIEGELEWTDEEAVAEEAEDMAESDYIDEESESGSEWDEEGWNGEDEELPEDELAQLAAEKQEAERLPHTEL